MLWGVYNFFYNEKPYVPLSRIYEKGITANDQPKSVPKVTKTIPVKKVPPIKMKEEISEVPENKGKLYTWVDKDGGTHFSNTAPPQNAKLIKIETEANPFDKRTKVEIDGHRVFVPITIKHHGKMINTSLLLDTGSTTAVLPTRVAKYINATYLGQTKSVVADGRAIKGERMVVEHFIVGPYVHKSFEVISQKVAGADNRGILGMDFLKSHPFTIDYDNKMIVWQ